MLGTRPPLLSCTGRVTWCSVRWFWFLFGFSCARTIDVQQLLAVSVDPTLAPLLDNMSTTWTPTEGLLLGSLNEAAPDVVLWGPVMEPPWMAFVSASTPCDRISEQVFFTEDKLSYSEAVFYDPKHTIRVEDPLLNTVKGVYTALACLMACIQSKNFTCKSVDYFWKDGGRCGLYNFTGQTVDYFAPHYSTTYDGSDHYDLLVDGNCSQEGVPYKSHNFATIAWKAFAVGWLELAAYEFDKAIRTGEKPLTAYLGRTLCHDDFGFSGVNSSYKEDILNLLNSTDLTLRLSKQEKLYFQALAGLLSANSLSQGSAQFAATIEEVAGAAVNPTADDLSRHALGLTLRGVALLNVDLRLGVEALVRRVQSNDMTAMAYLTRRFDPYNNGPEVLPYFASAVQAATTFHLMYLNRMGLLCADLIRSSINVLEAYGKWGAAAKMAKTFGDDGLNWLVERNLLVLRKGTYYLKDIGFVFISRDEQVMLYERAHFHLLQAGLFTDATEMARFIHGALSRSNSSFERAVVYRVLATAYYATSGNIFDSYAANVTFSSSAVTEQAEDDLMKWSVGYHQLALYLQNTSKADGDTTTAAYDGLQLLLDRYINATNPQSICSTALSMLLCIAKSRERENNGNMQEAIEAGRKGNELQATLANAAAPFVQGTKYFPQLFPIGHVYYGELLKRAFDSQNGTKRIVLVDACEAALLSAALWLPRNISTAILSLGKLYSSKERYRPNIALDYLRTLIDVWKSTNKTDEIQIFPGYYDAVSLKLNLELPICLAPPFLNSSEFWIVIAIAIAALIIAGVTVLTCHFCNRTKMASCVKRNRSGSKLGFKEVLSTTCSPLLTAPYKEKDTSTTPSV